ncbi:hypothetical protein Drorol1_Dr00002511, partial [Drosera rotundifolia]
TRSSAETAQAEGVFKLAFVFGFCRPRSQPLLSFFHLPALAPPEKAAAQDPRNSRLRIPRHDATRFLQIRNHLRNIWPHTSSCFGRERTLSRSGLIGILTLNEKLPPFAFGFLGR